MTTRSNVLRLFCLLFGLFAFATAANAQTPIITGVSPAFAFSGQPSPVSITGTNFGSSGTVTFNGVTASIAGWSSTSIAAYIPAQAQQATVVVSTSAGQSGGFTYYENLTPSLAELSPGSGAVGSTLTIYGPNLGVCGTLFMTVGGHPTPVSFTSTSGSIVTTVPAGATTGPLFALCQGYQTNQPTFTVTGPAFSLSTPPANDGIWVGSSGTWSVTSAVSGGFNAPITFVASGMPAGLTVTANSLPAPGSGTATVNITASSSVVPGVYSITLTGTGGGLTQTAVFNIYVTNLTISASPTAVSTTQGGSATSTITWATTSSPIVSSTTLSATGQPSGVTVSFAPATSGPSGTSTMTMAVASTVPTGTYPITVSATEGVATRTTSVNLTVIGPTFSLSTPPASDAIWNGTSGTWSVTSALSGGFNAPITFVASGMPAGLTVTVNSLLAPGSGTATVNITASSSVVPGFYIIALTGTGGGVTQATHFAIYVTGLTISASPTAVSTTQGGSATSTITWGTNSSPLDSGTALSATGQPSGVTISFSPATGAPSGTSTMAMAVASTVPAGTYPITVSATEGGTVRTTSVNLTVMPVPLSVVTVSLPSGTQYVPYSTTLQATGGQPPYTWSYSGNLPSGLQLSASGAITGSPLWSGSENFTVVVKDITQTTASMGLSISISPASGPPPPTNSVAYTYDTQGRVSTAMYTSPSGTVTVTYNYDNAGNRTMVVTQ